MKEIPRPQPGERGQEANPNNHRVMVSLQRGARYELKERLAAQERELFSRMVATEGRKGEHGVSKKRNKAGK